MLFGAGILLMTGRVEQRGRSAAALHYRRMGWLMFFGLLHGFLLWPGDILWTYGAAGMIVYPLRKRSPRTLLVTAMIFFAIGSGIFASVGAMVSRLPPEQYEAFEQENWRPTPEMIEDEIETYRGDWLGQMRGRFENALFMDTGVFLMLFGWKTIGNMLLGMALFKWGLFTRAAARSLYRRMAITGFLLGLPIVAFGVWRNFVAAWDGRYSFFFGSQFNSLGRHRRRHRLDRRAHAAQHVARPDVAQDEACGARPDGVHQLHPADPHLHDAFLWTGLRPVRISAARGSNRHRLCYLERPAAAGDGVAAPFPLWSARMALAITDLLALDADGRRRLSNLVI